jgi:WD40 repeat protein/serine/threonine protein kinase
MNVFLDPEKRDGSETEDLLLIEWVAELADRVRAGERVDLEALSQRHPERASALRRLLPTIALMGEIQGSGPRGACGSGLDLEGGPPRPEPGREGTGLGDFRLVREVGRGGMGVVYEAEQISLGRRVAVKVLPFAAALDPRQLRRFQLEAQAAALLHHAHIVPVHAVGCDRGVHYFAMQFIDGRTLADVIRELRRTHGLEPRPLDPATVAPVTSGLAVDLTAGSLETVVMGPDSVPDPSTESWGPGDPREGLPAPGAPVAEGPTAPRSGSLSSTQSRTFFRNVADLGRQAAEALEHAHRQGVLHRDIKPANLMLDTRGQLWITDFGLARLGDDLGLTMTGEVLGTLRYMSPESAAGGAKRMVVDQRTDIYSLGVTLYELLTLRPAYAGRDRAEILRQISEQEPRPLRRLNPSLPVDLETIIHKAIAKDAAGRYATAGELAEDLGRFLEDRPVRARRISPPERAWRWCQRNRAVAGLIATVFLLLSAVAGVASVGYVREAAERAKAERHRAAAQAAEVQAKGEAERALAAEARAQAEADRARTAEREMSRQWYAASINLMQPAWNADHVGRLRELLAATEAHPNRGFEWFYWQRLCHLEQHTLMGHRAGIRSVAWSPDGQRLATASWDMTARIWDAVTGRALLVLKGHASGVLSVAWSPDGLRLATASADGTAKVWPAAGGRELRTLKGHTGLVLCVAWSPDGLRLATGSQDGTVRVWDADAGGELRPPLASHAGVVRCLAWSPDGKRLATGGRDTLARVWDATTFGELYPPLKGHSSDVHSLAWSPDGLRLATGGGEGTAKVWSTADGRELLELKAHTSRILSVAWSPDGKRLATGSQDGSVKVWDPAATRQDLALKGHVSSVNSVCWSPDWTRLATGSEDGLVKAWDAVAGREMVPLTGPPSGVISLAWSPDGKRLAMGSFESSIRVWEPAGGREPLQLQGHTRRVLSVAWSPDGKWLASGSSDGTAKVWDVATGCAARDLKRHTGEVWSVAWSPDGQRLATAGWDRAVWIWDVATGRELFPLEGQRDAMLTVAYSPDGRRLATGSRDRTARVWDAATGRELRALKGHASEVWSVAWSPDGQRLATGGQDGRALVWDAAGGGEPLPLEGHAVGVLSVSWTPDGRRLATGSWDRTARVWDAADGRELLNLGEQGGRVSVVAWSPDGRRLATGSGDGTARLWDAADTESVQRWARQDRAVVDLLALSAFRGSQAQGFLRNWLLLLPLPLAPGEPGAQGLDRQQLPDEAALRPRAGEPASVAGELAWREHRSPEAVLDFNEVLGRATELSVAYAVCYIESDRPRDGLWVQVGSDDQAKVYLNGREIYRSYVPRALEALDTAGPVALEQGTNVLVLKVVNEGWTWEACARLVDEQGRPIEGIRVKLTPGDAPRRTASLPRHNPPRRDRVGPHGAESGPDGPAREE